MLTTENASASNGDLNADQQPQIPITANHVPPNVDNDLAMALRISELEQQQLQEEMKREQEMLEEVLRLSLQEK